jgi:hypothetical protein
VKDELANSAAYEERPIGMKRLLIYVLLGPLIGAATVLLIPWPSHGPALSVWQFISNPRALVIPYALGAPLAILVAGIDYGLRNYRWQWVYVVLAAALICLSFYRAKGFWLVGVVPAGICSFLANPPKLGRRQQSN